MPGFDYEELKRALKLIRSVCKDRKNHCNVCPFGTHRGLCNINEQIPYNWKIEGEERDIVRVMM